MDVDSPAGAVLNLKSLREQVYDYLREAMNDGSLAPGATIDLKDLGRRLGVSRTPLRDALLQLETEGFVTILPRRGCVVRRLTLDDVRDLYQVLGALESSVIRAEASRITGAVVAEMRRENEEMKAALDADDFDRYYAANLRFHDRYLDLSPNRALVRWVRIMKQRLYDFPRRAGYVKEWEVASTAEHERLLRFLAAGDAAAAADHMRDVHWSYEVQRRFIERYYEPDGARAGGGEGRER